MKKRKLRLDELAIESFDTDAQALVRGTVRAFNTCNHQTCESCAISCGGTCNTCPASCYGTCVENYTCAGQYSCDEPACTAWNAHC